MHAVVRQYTGAGALIDALIARRSEVEAVIRSATGFVSYQAVRDGDNLTSVTVCESRKGCEESTQKATAWVKANLPGVAIGAPRVTDGEMFLGFGR